MFDSARPNPSASFSLVVCSITRGPAKHRRAAGSAMMTSASEAKLASTPPVVGSVSTHTKGSRLSLSISRATVVFAICKRERMPSCMRAPPDAVHTTSGSESSTARITRRANISPTAAPMEPPRKRKSMTPRATGIPSMRQVPATRASARPVSIRASRRRSSYGLMSKKPSASSAYTCASSAENVSSSTRDSMRSHEPSG